MGGCLPAGQGGPAWASSSRVPLSLGGWAGSTEAPTKRGPFSIPQPPTPAESCIASWERSNHPFALCLPPQSSGEGLQCLSSYLFFETCKCFFEAQG